MENPAVERQARQVRRRLFFVLWLRAGLAGMAVWSVAWGLGILVLRWTVQMPPALLGWGAVGYMAALVVGGWLARRHLPGREAVYARLDHVRRAGGLILASCQADLGAWKRHIPPGRMVVRWRWRRAGGQCVAAAVFVVLALALPLQLSSQPPAVPLEVGDSIDRLDRQIQRLEEEQLLEEEQAEQLQETLRQIQAQAKADDPLNTLEPLDHLADRLKRLARQALEKSLAQAQALQEIENLARGIDQLAGQLEPQTLAQAMAELAALAGQAAQENAALAGTLDEQTRRAMEQWTDEQTVGKRLEELADGRPLDRQCLQQLAQACAACRSGLAGQAQRLAAERLLDARQLADLERACQRNEQQFAQAMAQLVRQAGPGQCLSLEQLVQLAQCSGGLRPGTQPGRGGITRGPGDAPMTFANQSTAQDAQFQPQTLPPGFIDSLKNSQLIGLSQSAAPVEPTAAGSTGGAVSTDRPAWTSAVEQQVLPRHRQVVRRYFHRTP